MSAGTVPDHPMGPITVEELLRRGTDAEIEGRALDVILRCGWPRPGDPLGIKPCIPITVVELMKQHEQLCREDVPAEQRIRQVRDFLSEQLKTQRYVMGLYVSAADAGG